MDIKVVFLDIDGTLVSFNTHAVPQSTIEAIRLLRKKGIKLVVATGRALRDINNLGDLEFDGYITANGAYCVTDKNEVLFKNLISKDNLQRLIDIQKDEHFPCIFTTDRGNYANYIDDTVRDMYKIVDMVIPEVKPMEEVVEYDVFQIDAFISESEEKRLLANVLTECEGSRWHPSFVDINVKGNTKAVGVEAFIRHLNIDISQTMAFGDGGNDVSMLQTVQVGIAMGNADSKIKTIADYTTSSVDEDGIINALKYFSII